MGKVLFYRLLYQEVYSLLLLNLPAHAGFGTEPMWLGMFTRSNTNCDSAFSCNQEAYHHGPTWNDFERFEDPGWIDVGITFDAARGQCVTMAPADGSSRNELSTEQCQVTVAPFACMAECTQGNNIADFYWYTLVILKKSSRLHKPSQNKPLPNPTKCPLLMSLCYFEGSHLLANLQPTNLLLNRKSVV